MKHLRFALLLLAFGALLRAEDKSSSCAKPKDDVTCDCPKDGADACPKDGHCCCKDKSCDKDDSAAKAEPKK